MSSELEGLGSSTLVCDGVRWPASLTCAVSAKVKGQR